MKLFDITNENYHLGHMIFDSLRSWPDTICQIDAATGDIETNASVLRRSVQFARRFLRFGIKPGDVLAIGGRNHINLHIPHYAALMIGMPPVTAHFGVSLVTGILKSEKDCDYSCFAGITIAGAKAHKKLLIQIQTKLRPGAFVSNFYGQTENLGIVLCPNPSGPIGNCGNCLFEWQKNIKLVDLETGKEITKPHVPGEMWTKVTCFTEYYNNPKETAAAFTDDGWYKTGDILYRDEEGNYFFVERLKMLIKYRNYHIMPPNIEAVIMEHPRISDVSVTSIPHEVDLEHPVACVVRKKGSHVTAQEIKDLVARHLSGSHNLRGGVVFLDEFPLTSTGKIARGKLKEMVLTADRE